MATSAPWGDAAARSEDRQTNQRRLTQNKITTAREHVKSADDILIALIDPEADDADTDTDSSPDDDTSAAESRGPDRTRAGSNRPLGSNKPDRFDQVANSGSVTPGNSNRKRKTKMEDETAGPAGRAEDPFRKSCRATESTAPFRKN